jgi:hypothetical protein
MVKHSRVHFPRIRYVSVEVVSDAMGTMLVNGYQEGVRVASMRHCSCTRRGWHGFDLIIVVAALGHTSFPSSYSS